MYDWHLQPLQSVAGFPDEDCGDSYRAKFGQGLSILAENVAEQILVQGSSN